MGFFKRAVDVIRSNINELINSVEDPEKLAELSISDAKEAYIRLKKESTSVVANAISVEKKYKKAEAEAVQWHEVAKKALASGNEGDAKAALANENKAKAKADDLRNTYETARADSEKVQDALAKLQARISEMEQRSDTIKAKASTARIKEKTASLDFGAASDITDTFNRMEEKADKALARAEAMESMNLAEHAAENADKDLLNKYSRGDAAADLSLEELKKEMGL